MILEVCSRGNISRARNACRVCVPYTERKTGGLAMDDLFEHQMQSERDKAINTFYTHFTTFLAVMAVLAIVALVSGDTDWVPWVILGWGAVMGLHAYEVFVRRPKRD